MRLILNLLIFSLAVASFQSCVSKKKFDELSPLFKKYGKQYGFDWLLLAAQGYQESKLDQSIKRVIPVLQLRTMLHGFNQQDPIFIDLLTRDGFQPGFDLIG